MATKKNELYNPYYDLKGISENKGLEGTAKATGGNADQYHYAAAPMYQNLVDNGYSDLANQLANTDYEGSLKILQGYSPTSSLETYWNTLNSFDGLRQNTSGIDPTSSQWQNLATGYLESSQNPKASETAQSIFDAFLGTNSLLNGELKYDENGNVISGLNTDHYNTGKNQLDYLNNFDVTEQSYYDAIMKQYNNLGQDAVQGAFAEGASTNSGNIDSFAQANANRQQIAYTTAGIQAALQAANQNQANWQNVYNSMTSHLASMGALNNDVLGHATNIYATDSEERQNALNAVTGLAGKEMDNNMSWYNNLLGYDQAIDKTKLGITSDLYTNDVNNEHDSWKTQYTTEAEAAEAEKDRQNQITLQVLQNGYDTAVRAEEKAAEEQAAKRTQYENGIKSFVDNAVRSFYFDENSKYGSLQDVYSAARTRYPDYDFVNLQSDISYYDSEWKKVAEEQKATQTQAIRNENIEAAKPYATQVIASVTHGEFPFEDAVYVLMETMKAEGKELSYSDAEKLIDDALSRYSNWGKYNENYN